MFNESQLPQPSSRAESRLFGLPASSAQVADGELGQRLIPQAVARAAAGRPRAVALSSESEALCYADLEARSNQLARYLISAGLVPDQMVGLTMERSPAMVIAALAILKAGGAYVPLDPMLPAERLAFILRDAEVRLLVTETACAAKLPNGSWRLVDVNQQADEIAVVSSHALSLPISEEKIAYVIYTSGSTGLPKGVEITHGGLANLVEWHCRAFQVTSNDRASHQAALGFDAAVWEIWPYLAAGSRVYIPPESSRTNPEALRDWLVARRISITFLATPLAERMLRLKWPVETALRILLTGADTLRHRPSPELPFALINNYGPTECTVVATSGMVAPGNPSSPSSLDQFSNQLPSIGRPIDNTQVYILNEQMQEVPAGTAGELCVAGAGLARGYHKRADLTLQKFVPNPFGSRRGDRLYRTGDLARYLPNGEIEFLGRLDEQIKIRGFRVEPDEIAVVLDQHTDVKASAVVARENQAGEKSLIAYVVLMDTTALTGAALREYLSRRLPDYMVPSVFVRMKNIPVTANGKVDRSGLPAPSEGNLLLDEIFVAPDGIVQQRLAGIVASLLRVDRISANDNFFLLGGHSLLGTQLIARVSETFGVELPLLQLFDHPTLAEMSSAIETLILLKLERAGTGQGHPDHADKPRS